eukprot:8417776-Pyramimonas_sp.AAC.1
MRAAPMKRGVMKCCPIGGGERCLSLRVRSIGGGGIGRGQGAAAPRYTSPLAPGEGYETTGMLWFMARKRAISDHRPGDATPSHRIASHAGARLHRLAVR